MWFGIRSFIPEEQPAPLPDPDRPCGFLNPNGNSATPCPGRMRRWPDYDWVGPDDYEWRVFRCSNDICQRVAYNVDELEVEEEAA